MTSAAFIAEHYICPAIGAILSTLTFMAPIRSLKSCTRDGSLGMLNPTPWAFMTGMYTHLLVERMPSRNI
jgi:solute carrier family 50 protein (sugar transporter)